MNEYKIELNLYQDCLYEIKNRINVIADHLNHITTEKYLIIEVETICLQFRKILEKIALMSLVANKKLYSEQHEKFAKHYHAQRILHDLERINPEFYPVPTKTRTNEKGIKEWIEIKSGYLTKEEFIKIYEQCGGMMHAQNPYASMKNYEAIQKCFPEWLTKICILLNHHHISLVGNEIKVVALMERSDNGLPQAVVFKRVN